MLHVEGVGKTYAPAPTWLRPVMRTAAREPLTALSGVSMDVERGEVVGLVGPNGAGKTTLLKIIATLLEPTEGVVTLDGHRVDERSLLVRSRLGLVLEGDQGLYGRLTGSQNLEFYGRLAGRSRPAARTRAAELMELMGLEGRDRLVFGYSAGMKMRLSIARALVGDPSLIVLDEPTRSLDPIASRMAIDLFRRLAAEGRGVLLSNHRLDEVVAICSRIVVIVDGTVRFSGAPSELARGDGEATRALADLLEREAARR